MRTGFSNLRFARFPSNSTRASSWWIAIGTLLRPESYSNSPKNPTRAEIIWFLSLFLPSPASTKPPLHSLAHRSGAE